MLSSARTTAALVGTLLAALALAGCSASGGGSGTSTSAAPSASTSDAAGAQTRAEACSAVKASLASTSELQSQIGQLASDPAAAATALRRLDVQLQAAIATVTEPAVKKAATKTEQSFDALATQVSTYAGNPASVDTTKLTKTVAQLQSRATALQKLCG